MPVCRECREEVDVLTTVRIAGRNRKLCEDCAELAQEAQDIASASEEAMQAMMGYRGRR